MKPIQKDELYDHFTQFLKRKGIEMKDGTYTQVVQKGCSIMADAVNLTQQGVEKARTEIDRRLEQIRQVIHEKTAPKPPLTPSGPAPAQTELNLNKASPVSQPASPGARKRHAAPQGRRSKRTRRNGKSSPARKSRAKSGARKVSR